MKQTDYIHSEKRPWGRFFIIQEKLSYKIKRIEVNPGKRLSYQYHNKRSEVWVIIQGTGTIILNDKQHIYSKGDTIIIPQGMKHRIENNGTKKTIFIEVQTGSYFGEDDIVRLEDDFNRK
ncbi:phosphomannose isomerase type II C-terminal cupin domain [Flavobacteriaceae bacterium]|nr:phosphomannose isomerase type II C-terminal cupin domain [Flavobacteriaceae bacterium]